MAAGRMPAEWAPHERTLMAWPCRAELWESELAQARVDHAAVVDAVAAFEPVTLLARPEDVADARAAVAGSVDVVARPIDDSWARDSGPIFVLDASGRRVGVHFRFNGWGEKFTPYDGDEDAGRWFVEHLGDPLVEAPFVLEGGSIAVDGEGTLLTTEECLLHPNRNPGLGRDELEALLREHLGVERVVWLGQGLVEDRDTDGHVDLIASFCAPGRVLLQAVPDDNPNAERMAENRRRAEAAGLEVVPLDRLAYVEVAGEEVAVSYLNHYVCNGAVIVPVAGTEDDEPALATIGDAFPGREVVPVPGRVLAYGGGGPHCITQQVPMSAAPAARP
jgi:agmatine deiminase